MIVKEEVRSGEETLRKPRAYTERSTRRYVRTVRLVQSTFPYDLDSVQAGFIRKYGNAHPRITMMQIHLHLQRIV